MKKYILGTLFTLCILISPAFMPQAEAAALSTTQISAIIGLLQAFGADQSVIANVQAALGGGALSTGSAALTVNGQTQVNNADPLVQRTWAWSGTSGATYTASGNITGCDTASQNGTQSNWTPWTAGTGVTGTASNGSSAATPGTVKYGCTIVGTYNVTKDGNTTTGTASITFKHANAAANYLLTVTTTGSGVVTPDGVSASGYPRAWTSSNYPPTQTVVLTATPDQGFTFTGWTGACTNITGTCAVTMSGDKSVTATFSSSAAGTPSITVTPLSAGNNRGWYDIAVNQTS